MEYLNGIENICNIILLILIAKWIYGHTKDSEKKYATLSVMAAAVSDFYIPEEKLSQHKIQSREFSDGLEIKLDQVPKLLKEVHQNWNPKTWLVWDYL